MGTAWATRSTHVLLPSSFLSEHPLRLTPCSPARPLRTLLLAAPGRATPAGLHTVCSGERESVREEAGRAEHPHFPEAQNPRKSSCENWYVPPSPGTSPAQHSHHDGAACPHGLEEPTRGQQRGFFYTPPGPSTPPALGPWQTRTPSLGFPVSRVKEQLTPCPGRIRGESTRGPRAT